MKFGRDLVNNSVNNRVSRVWGEQWHIGT